MTLATVIQKVLSRSSCKRLTYKHAGSPSEELVSLTRRYQRNYAPASTFAIPNKKKGPPPMSLGELFASIRERRRRSAQQPYEEGAHIRRRLQELLVVPSPTQVETSFTNARIENHPTCYCDGRLHRS